MIVPFDCPPSTDAPGVGAGDTPAGAANNVSANPFAACPWLPDDVRAWERPPRSAQIEEMHWAHRMGLDHPNDADAPARTLRLVAALLASAVTAPESPFSAACVLQALHHVGMEYHPERDAVEDATTPAGPPTDPMAVLGLRTMVAVGARLTSDALARMRRDEDVRVWRAAAAAGLMVAPDAPTADGARELWERAHARLPPAPLSVAHAAVQTQSDARRLRESVQNADPSVRSSGPTLGAKSPRRAM